MATDRLRHQRESVSPGEIAASRYLHPSSGVLVCGAVRGFGSAAGVGRLATPYHRCSFAEFGPLLLAAYPQRNWRTVSVPPARPWTRALFFLAIKETVRSGRGGEDLGPEDLSNE